MVQPKGPGKRVKPLESQNSRRPFASVSTDTLPQRVSRELIVGILRGDFQPGDELPAEDALAQEFGVSRPVVREAVKHLSVLGLVQSRQGRQSRVASYESWNHFAPEILIARRDAGAVEDVLLELLELRRMIEVEAAALAAARATPDDLESMAAALTRLDASIGDPDAFTLLDIEFHDAVLGATKNHLLPRLFETLRPLLEFGREVSLKTTASRGTQASQAGHRAVYEAVHAGAPSEARRHMEEHLSWTANLDINDRNIQLALKRARTETGGSGR